MKSFRTACAVFITAIVSAAAGTIQEREVSIMAVPVFTKKSDGSIWISADKDGTKISEPYGNKTQLPLAKLDPGKPYRFDVIEVRRGGGWVGTLLRIADGDHVIHDFTACPVHHLKLERRNVPVAYGMDGSPPAYHRVVARLFPCANTSVPDGCGIGGGSEKETRAFQCDRCVEAEKAWREAWAADHPRTP